MRTKLSQLTADFDEMRKDEGNNIENRNSQECRADHRKAPALNNLVDGREERPGSESHVVVSIGPPDFEIHYANLMPAGLHPFQEVVPLVRAFRNPVRLLEHENSHTIGLAARGYRGAIAP